MNNKPIKLNAAMLTLSLWTTAATAQTIRYNRQELVGKGQILRVPSHETKVLEGTKPGAITTKGINFKDGTMEKICWL
jgi:hypothetical protein